MHHEILVKSSDAFKERRLLTYCLPDMQAETPFAAWSAHVLRKPHSAGRPSPADYVIVPCRPTGYVSARGAAELMRDWSKVMEASAVVWPPLRSAGDVNGEHIPVLAALLRGEDAS